MGVKVEDSARPDPRQGRCFMSRQQGPNYKTLVLWYSVDKLYHLAALYYCSATTTNIRIQIQV